MKQKKPIINWNEETGIATCTLESEYGVFVGTAKCHPDDEDMMSEKVGCEIAYCRAAIKSLIYERDCIIKPSLKALRQLYYSINRSKHFNPKSYETKMLWGQIRNWQTDLTTINTILNREKEMLKDYIETKEAFYQNVRKKRNSGQN